MTGTSQHIVGVVRTSSTAPTTASAFVNARDGNEDHTASTETFSGKPARGRANRFLREMTGSNAAQLAFPAQNSVTGKLRAASAKAGNPDFVAMWAGQALALSRALPAAELIARLEAEAVQALRRTSEFVKE